MIENRRGVFFVENVAIWLSSHKYYWKKKPAGSFLDGR